MATPAGGADGPPIVALVGPTGSGKSALALEAADAAGAVIVAVDAFTVYRGMDIGTATPTAADRARVPHRMVDVLEVEEECTVSWFQARARAAIDEVRAAGRPALLVGGSGLYLRAVVDALEFPPTDPDLRPRIEADVAADPPAAHARLAADDPAAAARIEPSNTRRITRALEVAALTGRPFSSYRTAWEDHTSIYPGLRIVGVHHPPAALADRIDARTRQMLAAGWVGECRALADRDLSATAAQAIGYAELIAHVRAGGGVVPDDLVDAIAARTRRFAARQRRWFRRDPRVGWDPPDRAGDRVVTALAGRGSAHEDRGDT
ncbi:tRNA (adenosine(37)-N6)-dimethylallyltransferase MiaA [Euzebya sp.]|uniref:tRNA (adenosine(37)-N6)-dimethylallyltransferase MiaA n=1 Tax=Euzebya sp. TaxID=1971409 RepID=UPI003510E041